MSARAAGRSGFAMLAVLLALLALLVLCTPFLLTARNASRSSARLADRVQARLALDAAGRHARAQLGRSHASVDRTPYFDDIDELDVRGDLDEAFWNARDPRGPMWDLSVSDVSGRIDWNSAPPQAFANALGLSSFLVALVEDDAEEIPVASTSGFPPAGFLVIDGEIVRYGALEASRFLKLVRGLAAGVDAEGHALDCGPQPARGYPAGLAIFEQRAVAPAQWRLAGGELRAFASAEEVLGAVGELGLGGPLEDDALRRLAELGTTWAGVGAGAVWQRPVRVSNDLAAGLDCWLQVDELRWFNPGTTVRLTDGRTTELGLVRSVEAGRVQLFDPVTNAYAAFTAELSPLARRPVNANTASAEVLEALFLHLQWRGVNSRITRREARELAALTIVSRPFDGFEDFLRRLVLPAAGLEPLPQDAPVVPAAFAQGPVEIVSPHDALALYANALNANDSGLAYSTLPLCFTSSDVYELELRASVNAPSGVERVQGVRRLVEAVVPQGERLHLWARQEDFDQELRLSRAAPWWATGPRATSRAGRGDVPPSRLWAHVGTADGVEYLPGVTPEPVLSDSDSPPTPEHVFASRDEDGFARLWPSRVAEIDDLDGHVLHFDHETRDAEGRYLPDESLFRLTDDDQLDWTSGPGQLLRALDFGLWVRPRALADGVLLDVGTTALETDRVTLSIEGPDLVLRVLDGPGDHRDTVEIEAGEVRFDLLPGTGPGLAPDTWSHVYVDVRGNRPDQMTMLVDGRAFGVRTMGQSRLAGPAPDGSGVISLESGEGFPDRGVVRIGDELIEYVKSGANVLQADYRVGFGGRLAREKVTYLTGTTTPVSAAIGLDTDHERGTTVQLYGYSKPLRSNVPDGSAQLGGDLGLYAVGRVTGVGIDGDAPDAGEDVTINPGYSLGRGIDGGRVTALEVAPADAGATSQELMSAFDAGGGYVLVVQAESGPYDGPFGPSANPPITTAGLALGLYEVMRYTGHDGQSVLQIGARGSQLGFQNPAAPGDRRAFVIDWSGAITWGVGGGGSFSPSSVHGGGVYVLPISIHAPGVQGFLQSDDSELAQITRLDDPELTEWVRYDEVVGNDHLVRNNRVALGAAYNAAVFGSPGGATPPTGNFDPLPPAPSAPPAAPPPPAPTAAPQTTAGGPGGPYWLGEIGQNEFQDRPISRAVSEQLQFRGVFGTYCHAQPGGALVLPAWRVLGGSVDNGLPGRHDAAFLVDADPADLGWPVVIHWTHNPNEYRYATWEIDPSDPLRVVAGPEGVEMQSGIDGRAIYVALREPAPVPVAPGSGGPCTGNPIADTRCISRLVKFPSGERPRFAANAWVGQALRGGLVPSATVDEVVFGSAVVADATAFGDALQGASFRLAGDLTVGSTALLVQPDFVRVPLGLVSDSTSARVFLTDLPPDGGLLRIGEEIVAYESYDAPSGAVNLAAGGRGLLGTVEQHHEAGEVATWLERWDVAVLSGGVGASDASFPVGSLAGFPREGTVLLGQELVHYTRQRGNALDMPRLSETPGAMDRRGGGIFRGRFGTAPQAHAAGTPAILFPFRYWDRWADRADGPELAYFGFTRAQASAFWRGVFWTGEEPASGGVELELLARTDARVPWDADPEGTEGLFRFVDGLPRELPNALGHQSDRLDVRLYARYGPGAFDSATGLSHAWKETPRVDVLGVEYLAPYVTLSRVDE